MTQSGELLGVLPSLEAREHVGNGKGPYLILPPADIARKGEGMNRADLHISRELSIYLFFRFPVVDKVQNF